MELADIHEVDYCDSLDGATPTQVRELVQDKIVHYQAQIDRLQGHIRRLKAAHNAVSTFHVKMPTEILMHIFRQVNPSSRRDIQLTHVCRTWRSVIHHTPEFWRDLVLTLDFREMDSQTLDELLARSAPLGFGLDFDRPEYLSFLTTNLSSTRLSSLKLVIYDRADLGSFAQLNLPSLESLKLESDDFIKIDRDDTLRDASLSRQFPRLHSLSIVHCLLLPAFTPPSLRYVTVSRDIYLTLDNLVACLVGCPDLQTLTLEDCWIGPSQPNIAYMSPPVELPQLRNLSLVGLSLDVHYHSCITYPRTTYVFLKQDSPRTYFDTDTDFPAWALAATSPLSKVIFNATSKGKQGDVSQTISFSGYLYMTDSQPRLTIEFQNPDYHPLMPNSEWWNEDPAFFSCLPVWMRTTEAVQTLELHLHDETLHLSLAIWESILQSFNSVLLLVVDVTSCRDFFRALDAVPIPLSLQELQVMHQDRLDRGDHEIIVSAVEHLVATSSRLKRLAITFQAGDGQTEELPAKWSAVLLGRLRAAVEELVLGNEV